MTMLTDDREMDPAAEGAQARLSAAWHWLCEQRAGAPEHADVWDIRWQHLNTGEGWLTALEGRLLRGTYRLSPLQLHGQGVQRRAVWGAQDALVLKWVALSLQHLLPLHPSCEHVKGHGGGKPPIETLRRLLTAHTTAAENPTGTPHYRWVCRTDIRGYYRNIRKETLMQQVRQHVISPVLRDLVHQYLHYTVEDGGTFHTPEKGISRGCPLSPLMGALHLYDMDAHFSRQQGIHYARYMDDVIILATSRWSLRKQTKQLMQWFGAFGFEAHPHKTFIGRTEKGFDWMGAWLTHEGVTDIAPRAKANHREKVRRLYERLARVPFWKRKRAQKQVHARVSAYRLRWNIWAACVLAIVLVPTPSMAVTVTPATPAGTVLGTWTGTLRGNNSVANMVPVACFQPDTSSTASCSKAGETKFGGYGWVVGNVFMAVTVSNYDGVRVGQGTSTQTNATNLGVGAAGPTISCPTCSNRSDGRTVQLCTSNVHGAAPTTFGGVWGTYSFCAGDGTNGRSLTATAGSTASVTITYYLANTVQAGELITEPHGLQLNLCDDTGGNVCSGVRTISASTGNPPAGGIPGYPAAANLPVTCTISDVTAGSSVPYQFGEANSAAANKVVLTLPLTLRSACTGTNDTGAAVSASVSLAPTGGSALVQGTTNAVRDVTDTAMFLTMTTGTASCTSVLVPLDGTPVLFSSTSPGADAPATTDKKLNANLCATGKPGVGAKTIHLTATSVLN